MNEEKEVEVKKNVLMNWRRNVCARFLKEFDNVYISFSKDSGVLLSLCIDYIRRNNLNVRIGVFHMDYEIQYKMTIDYVDRMIRG